MTENQTIYIRYTSIDKMKFNEASSAFQNDPRNAEDCDQSRANEETTDQHLEISISTRVDIYTSTHPDRYLQRDNWPPSGPCGHEKIGQVCNLI